MSKRRAPIPLPLGLLLAPLYRAAVAHRNKRFDKGKNLKTAPIPVISIGNITVGGVGKTPFVHHVAKVLKMAGKRPGIVLRGYKAEPGQLSDEHAEHKRRAPDIPVVANPNRYEAVAQLIASAAAKPDAVILDDGFQHRRLRRTLDLVLIDATQNPFRDRLLPAGWLREPVENLARASAVVLTHVDHVSESELRELRDAVDRLTGVPPIAECVHAWAKDVPALINARETTKPVEWLAGKKAVVTCALGNPAPFVHQVRLTGATIETEILLKDHARFTGRDVDRIIAAARNADAVVCTAKDWTKLSRVKPDRWPCPVLRPTVEIEIRRGRDELAERIESAALTRRDHRTARQNDETQAADDAA